MQSLILCGTEALRAAFQVYQASYHWYTPTGLARTGFNRIKTDAGIPFHTRGGIPRKPCQQRLPALTVYTAWGVTRFFGLYQPSEIKHAGKAVR